MRVLGIALALLFMPLPTSVAAQPLLGNSASYFCVVEFVGGISVNETTQKWEATKFRPEGKFVLRLKFLKSRIEKDFMGKDGSVYDYNVTLTEAGQNYALPCEDHYRATDRKIITLRDSPFVACNSALSQYRIDLETNRFIRAYLEGYTDGKDTNANTPSVSAGTCTRID